MSSICLPVGPTIQCLLLAKATCELTRDACPTVTKLYSIACLQTVLDAIRARKERFTFENIEMRLQPSVMAFITMNPGYPGRAELPESLKVHWLPNSDEVKVSNYMNYVAGWLFTSATSNKYLSADYYRIMHRCLLRRRGHNQGYVICRRCSGRCLCVYQTYRSFARLCSWLRVFSKAR